MEEFFTGLLNTFIPIFVAIDIFGVLPLFISFTAGLSAARRRQVVRQSVFTALVVSLLFTAFGKGIFGIMGITVSDFKVAGGAVLLVLAVLDLTRGEKQMKSSGTIGVVPIGVPLIVGPAVLTTIIVLIDQYGLTTTLLSLILNFIVVWLSFISAEEIVRFMGRNGVVALSKIVALLLAAIAVKMIRLGIEDILTR